MLQETRTDTVAAIVAKMNVFFSKATESISRDLVNHLKPKACILLFSPIVKYIRQTAAHITGTLSRGP